MVDHELGLLPDDALLLETKDYKRFQLANRTLNTIRINEKLWSQLDDSQKIDLIIHEMIYSLLNPTCIDQNCVYKKQSARFARQITGMLFSRETYIQRSEKENTLRAISQHLELDGVS